MPGQKGEFLWSASGMWTILKQVLPADEDPERMEVYEAELASH